MVVNTQDPLLRAAVGQAHDRADRQLQPMHIFVGLRAGIQVAFVRSAAEGDPEPEDTLTEVRRLMIVNPQPSGE